MTYDMILWDNVYDWDLLYRLQIYLKDFDSQVLRDTWKVIW